MDLNLRVTVIGDSAVGKTSMLLRYTRDAAPGTSLPTIYENFEGTVDLDETSYRLQIQDTAGAEGYENIRRLSFFNVDCFILCFAIDSRQSFDNIVMAWVDTIKIISSDYKLVLVGTKGDQRDANPENCVCRQEINKLVKAIKASSYVECSAITKRGIEEVFEAAVKAVTANRRNSYLCFPLFN